MTKLKLRLDAGLRARLAAIKEGKRQPRSPKFLPGERPKDTYHRFRPRGERGEQYSSTGVLTYQDLVPPRHSAPVNIGDEQYSPHYVDSCYRNGLVRMKCECNAAKYINTLHEHLHTTEYRTWSVGGWTWHEDTADTFPPNVTA